MLIIERTVVAQVSSGVRQPSKTRLSVFVCVAAPLPYFSFLKLFCDADVSIFLSKTGSGAHRWQAGFKL